MTPEQFIARVRATLPILAPEEARDLIQLAHAWTFDHYGYDGVIPEQTLRDIRSLGDIPNARLC